MRPINLLPPEVARERSRRRRVAIAIFGAFAYVFLLGVGVLYWNGKVDAARDDLDAQVSINQALEREVTALSETADVRIQYEEKATLVRDALATDVDWGILLNDLARLLPPRVWVETFNGSVAPETIPGIIGQISFSGVGFDFPDVSAWLRALDSDQFAGITGPWVSIVTQGIIGAESVVTFSSTAVLTTGAAADRADTLIPEVP
ncbi:MAG TPA: PilN domain-containing protein [Acidimicrobiia bacterium]|nr:PilN domain-containing protein [Acidimicrobiia bacterium]